MQRTRFRTIGMALLAIAGVMAVSASAASAKFQLLKGGSAVNKLELTGTGLLGKLVAENGITVHCTGSVVTATLETLSSGATLDGAAHVLYEGCSVEGAPTCTIFEDNLDESMGPEKKILASGAGTAIGMDGEGTLILATGAPFARFWALGSKCPIAGLYEVSGSVRLQILNSGTNAVEHLVHTTAEELFLGESVSTLEGGEAHVKELTGATWAIDLL